MPALSPRDRLRPLHKSSRPERTLPSAGAERSSYPLLNSDQEQNACARSASRRTTGTLFLAEDVHVLASEAEETLTLELVDHDVTRHHVNAEEALHLRLGELQAGHLPVL